MIETLEEYERAKCVASAIMGPTTRKAMETIDALLVFVAMVREERIVSVGSYVSACTLCDTSWLSDREAEHHEASCIFHDLPEWMRQEKH